MASVISLSPHSPLHCFYGNHSFESSRSSLNSSGSQCRASSLRPRQVSLTSLVSGNSLYAPSWYQARERTPIRPASTIAAIGRVSPRRRSISSALSRPQSIAASTWSDVLPQVQRPQLARSTSERTVEKTKTQPPKGLSFLHEEDSDSGHESWHDSSELPTDLPTDFNTIEVDSEDFATRLQISDEHGTAFKRWMSTLRRRTSRSDEDEPVLTADFMKTPPQTRPSIEKHNNHIRRSHQKSDSQTSSLGFVTAVKSASLTVASSSLPSMARPSFVGKSPQSRRWMAGSIMSTSEARRSIDSNAAPFTPAVDEAARKRSFKRREKINELVRTEEGYLSDLRALSNVFFNILLPHATLTPQTKSALQSNLSELLKLHDELNRDLRTICPAPDYIGHASPVKARQSRHMRFKSADEVTLESPARKPGFQIWQNRRSLNFDRSAESDPLGLGCSPQTAAEIAKCFLAKIRRFSVYEEYGARCDLIHLDIDFAQKTLPFGQVYDRAIEALHGSINSVTGRAAHHRRALGMKDLLVKPIQRITRYEMLFKDLCALTPSCDDPTSHLVLDDVLYAITQTCQNVNEARDNPEKLRLMENQRLLQERLVFEDKMAQSQVFRHLGRLSLCGALFVAYKTRNGIKGQYAVCALYESCLIIASAPNLSRYRVLVAAPLSMSKVDEADNGKGIQCHTTPHAWKLLFEDSGKLYELLMVACSGLEASTWRDHISGRIAVETKHLAEGRVTPIETHSPLAEDLKNVGKAYGKSTDFARKLSVHRAATLGPAADINQVIIKNTQAKETPENASTSSLPTPIPRSQSLATPCHIPVLAPRRTERIQLEHLLSDVWTKDALPWPGLGSKWPEYNIRASANHVMRKLSMASIASNFSKRSMSHASISQSSISEMKPPKPPKPLKLKSRATPVPPPSSMSGPPKLVKEQKPVINFHTAPDAFLPEDFDLKNTTWGGRKLGGLRTFTIATERPRSPFFSTENKAPDVRRAKSAASRPSKIERRSTEPMRALTPQPVLSADMRKTDMAPSVRAKPVEFEGRMTTRQRAKSRLMKLLG